MIETGRYYQKQGGDYQFEGTCVAVFKKQSGVVRVVLEDERGLLFIFSPSQLHELLTRTPPTIEELEAILNDPNQPCVWIRPDGTITETDPDDISHVKKAPQS